MHLLKIENESSLVKDMQSKAVLNLDTKSYQSYLNQRKKLKENKDKIDSYECQLKALIDEVNLLKDSVKTLFQTGNK